MILLLNIFISTVTVFFAPAEAAMIPVLVPRGSCWRRTAIFTLTLNAAFALGFALLGPARRQRRRPRGADPGRGRAVFPGRGLLLHVAAGAAAAGRDASCIAASASGRPSAPSRPTLAQLREGFGFIRANRAIAWSLIYLAIAASLVGVLGVLGPDFAKETLGLEPRTSSSSSCRSGSGS